MTESFVKILQLAQELKLAKFGQVTVSIDGTKIAANASKHAAVSYARAGEQLAQRELEVAPLLEKKPTPAAPAPGASIAEVMRHRLQSATGKALYKLRQQTVEPVFGIIKSVLGFRQFLLRGTANVSTEWSLVCLAYTLKRLHRLGAGQKLALAG